MLECFKSLLLVRQFSLIVASSKWIRFEAERSVRVCVFVCFHNVRVGRDLPIHCVLCSSSSRFISDTYYQDTNTDQDFISILHHHLVTTHTSKWPLITAVIRRTTSSIHILSPASDSKQTPAAPPPANSSSCNSCRSTVNLNQCFVLRAIPPNPCSTRRPKSWRSMYHFKKLRSATRGYQSQVNLFVTLRAPFSGAAPS